MNTMLTVDETVECASCFIRRFFGFAAGEQTLAFFRKAAESGLTIAEFIAAVKTAALLGREAAPDALIAGFRRECRLAWKRMQDENNPGSR